MHEDNEKYYAKFHYKLDSTFDDKIHSILIEIKLQNGKWKVLFKTKSAWSFFFFFSLRSDLFSEDQMNFD